MFRFTIIFLLLLCTYYVSSNNKAYKFPNPTFDVRQNIFQVFLPDEDGIELFYFYGRVLKKNGEIVKIIMDTREKTNGQWLLTAYRHSLEVGDTVTYWLYIRKDGVGYRMPYGVYKIEHVISAYITTTEHDPYTTSIVEPTVNKFIYSDPVNLDSVPEVKKVECKATCDHELKNMTDMVTSIELHMESLEEMVMRIWEKLNQKHKIE